MAMTAAPGFNLRDVQRATLNKQLTTSSGNHRGAPWRVLIVDSYGEEIVNTLLTASDLRSHNITLQLRLDAETRAPLSGDVPALYIISPTPENIARVLRDVDGAGSGRRAVKRLYPSATVAFTTLAPSSLLAALASKIKLPARITGVHDLYSHFVSLEDDLFTINSGRNTYADLHSGNVGRFNRVVDMSVEAIFCVLATLRVMPIIRAQRFGAAEAVARKLHQRLREYLDRFGRPVSFRRPLLLLLDRDIDLAPLLHHTWTYQALVHDCLETERNSVALPIPNTNANGSGEKATGGKPAKKKYPLNKDADPFWKEQAYMPFPAVADAINIALAEYQDDVAKINRQSTTRAANSTANGEPNGSADEAENTNSNTTGELVSAIKSLPELSRRKEALDNHTTIGTALLELIGERKLDTFFEFETAILDDTTRIGRDMTPKHVASHMSAFEELLRGDAGTPMDRLRAACLFYCALGSVMGAADFAELKTLLRDSVDGDGGGDISGYVDALMHVKQVYIFDHRKEEASNAEVAYTQGEGTSTGWTRPSFRGMMKSVVKKGYRGITAFAESAKTLMAERGVSFKTARTLHLFLSEKARDLTDPEAVDAVLDEYVYLDPKVDDVDIDIDIDAGMNASRDRDEEAVLKKARRKKRRTIYSDAIVFVCGGGSYVELGSLKEGIAQLQLEAEDDDGLDPPKVLYGCTEVLNAERFMRQIDLVVKESKSRTPATSDA